MIRQFFTMALIAAMPWWISCHSQGQSSMGQPPSNVDHSYVPDNTKPPETGEAQKGDTGLNANGGSVVGNGFNIYQSKVYNFRFSYAQRLTLTEISAEHIVVDDRNDLSQLKPQVDFKITYSQVQNLEALYLSLSASHPEMQWTTIRIGGVDGYSYKTEKDGYVFTYYFFALYPGTILEVTTIDHIGGEEGSEVKAIVESLTFDIAAPVVEALHFEKNVIKAGETAKLMFKASDDLSGVRGLSPSGTAKSGLWFGTPINGTECIRLLVKGSFRPFGECLTFQDEGEGWYSYSVPTSLFLKPGSYTISTFKLWDAAGNSVHSTPDWDRPDRFFVGRVDFALPIITILNDHPDLKAPELHDVHFTKTQVEAGESVLLSFGLTDEDPKASARECISLQRRQKEGDREVLSYHSYHTIESCTPPVYADGKIKVKFEISKGVPAGEYYGRLYATDSADNVGFADINLTITNSGEVDFTKPELLDVKTLKKEYRIGETLTVLARYKDDLSGVTTWNENFDLSRGCRQIISPVVKIPNDFQWHRRTEICSTATRDLGDGWIAYDLRLGLGIPLGSYYVSDLRISDRVGNLSTYWARIEDSDNRFYFLMNQEFDTDGSLINKSEEATTVPVVMFEIVR